MSTCNCAAVCGTVGLAVGSAMRSWDDEWVTSGAFTIATDGYNRRWKGVRRKVGEPHDEGITWNNNLVMAMTLG